MQASHRLNVRSDRTIFHDLIAINVNDSVLELPSSCRRRRQRSKRRSFRAMDKDPEPVLADYLQPIEMLCHRVTLDDVAAAAGQRRPACMWPPYADNYADVYGLFDSLNCEYY